jgi:hypothetical protein
MSWTGMTHLGAILIVQGREMRQVVRDRARRIKEMRQIQVRLMR